MSATPTDATSLLVPIQLDAWVNSPNNNTVSMAAYEADYNNLKSFDSPEPAAFGVSQHSPNDRLGITLHWSLPDALTHGRTLGPDSTEVVFPFVPNRWLVARFQAKAATDPGGGQWLSKVWVIKSDQVGKLLGNIGPELPASPTGLTLAKGALLAVAANTTLTLQEDETNYRYRVVTAAAVAAGDTKISLKPNTNKATAHSCVVSVGGVITNNFLDPDQPTLLQTDATYTTTPIVQAVSLGLDYSVEAWEATTDPATQPFLTAVGAGSVAFAAYQPFVNNVFAFTDADFVSQPETQGQFTYLVTGWYADWNAGAAASDPMAALSAYPTNPYLAASWDSEAAWKGQHPEERLATMLAFFKWSSGQPDAANLPKSTLCHGLVAGVQWPYTGQVHNGNPTSNPNLPDPGSVQLAIAASAPEALATIIRAQPHAAGDHAPDVLADLVQAALYNLLGDYGQAGGQALVRQKTLQAAFGQQAGGLEWEVVPHTTGANQPRTPPTAAQATAIAQRLAELNTRQRAYDAAVRQLRAHQANLYRLWLKVGQVNYNKVNKDNGISPPLQGSDWASLLQYLASSEQSVIREAVRATQQQLTATQAARALVPDPFPAGPHPPADPVGAWVAAHWPALKLNELGLLLKPGTAPSFWHPNDPTLLLTGLNRAQKFGEDGRYNADGTLSCRLPGHTITGLQLPGQPVIDTPALTRHGLAFPPYGTGYRAIPGIPLLAAEAFFADAANSALLAAAANAPGADSAAIAAAINALVEPVFLPAGGAAPPPPTASWQGTAPAAFSLARWQQPWIPLFLEWQVRYYPTVTGEPVNWQFVLPGNWHFDGQDYRSTGQGCNSGNVVSYQGRTVLTAGAPLLFKDRVEKYLAGPGHAGLTPAELAQVRKLLGTIGHWDVVSQSLSGLTDQLVTLLSQQTFPPPPDPTPAGGAGPAAGAPAPSLTALIGEEYHTMPQLEKEGFFPIRGGFLHFTRLQVVDSFGQVLPLLDAEAAAATASAPPLLAGPGFAVPAAARAKGSLPADCVQLPPRAVQGTRLALNLLSNDNSGRDLVTSANSNAVCGWLLPNHLDYSLAVYDADGRPLGELLPPPTGWRPRPGPPGASPPPATVHDVPNVGLREVLASIAGQNEAAFRDLLQVIDKTLWTVDPLGNRQDQALSVLIGRPLAVVQLALQLELDGPPLTSQTWRATIQVNATTKPPTYSAQSNDGGLAATKFPVRLGSPDLRHDGLIGYFLPAEHQAHFYAVHPELGPAGYIQPIMQGETYQGNVTLSLGGARTVVTLLLDPRGSVHAATGVLPVTATALAPHVVEDFVRQLQVTFQTGPLLADPGTLRLPLPAENQGTWSWVQQVAPASWHTTSPVRADDQARMPPASPTLQEGWLQLMLADPIEPSPAA